MSKIKRVGNSLVKELSAMMDEMTVSVENCLQNIQHSETEPSSEKNSTENYNGASLEKGVSRGGKGRFSHLVDELQEALYPEQQPELTDSDISWLSGILRDCREEPSVNAAFAQNGELKSDQPSAPANQHSDEEIYGQKKRHWNTPAPPAAETAAGDESNAQGTRKIVAVSPKKEKKAGKPWFRTREKVTKTEKTGSRRLMRTMVAGVMAGVCLILGMVGTEGYFQRHFVATLEKSFHGKVRYSAMNSSMSRMTVAMENTEMVFDSPKNESGGEKSRPGIQVERAVFQLDPYALVKGRVVVQDALMEGMQFSSPEGFSDKNGNAAAAQSWSLTPLLSSACEAEIEKQLASLTSVKYFQEMKARYVPRYKELARQSHEVNRELADIRQQLQSRIGATDYIPGLFPTMEEHRGAAENLSRLAPRDTAVRLVNYDLAAHTPADREPGAMQFFHEENAKSAQAAAAGTGDEDNVEYMVQTITRLIQLRQASEKIYSECAELKLEIANEMQQVQAKVAEDGKTFRPYLEPPVLDEAQLAGAFFGEQSVASAREMTAWLEMLQQVVAGGLERELAGKSAYDPSSADISARFGKAVTAKNDKKSAAGITVQRAATRGNVTLFGQQYAFSGDWKTVPAEGEACEKMEAEIVLTPAGAPGEPSASAAGKIVMVMEEDAGVLKKRIRAEFPVSHMQACYWAVSSLPVRAVPASAVVRMDLTYRGDEISGDMELAYRDVTLASVHDPAVKALPPLGWEDKIKEWKTDTLAVSAHFSGTRQAPRVECHADQLAPFVPIYTETLAALYRGQKDHVANRFHQKLVDTEDSFHGAIQPVYEQIALKTGSIAQLQDGLQGFLVQNMRQDVPAGTHPSAPAQGGGGYAQVPTEYYAVAETPGYAVVGGKTYYTAAPQPHAVPQPHSYAAVAAPPAGDFLLDAPVFNPEWSTISGAVGADANAVMEAYDYGSESPALPPAARDAVMPPSENAVHVPVRKMTVQERNGVLILTDSPTAEPTETYVPTYQAPAPTSGEVFQDPAHEAGQTHAVSETDTSGLFREEMNRAAMMQATLARPGTSTPLPVGANAAAPRKGTPLPMSATSGSYGK